MLIVDKNSQFYSICAIKKGGNTDSGQRNFHIGKFFSSKLLFFEIKNIEPIFPWKVKNMKKCSNHEKLRTIEAHTKITGSYNKKVCIVPWYNKVSLLYKGYNVITGNLGLTRFSCFTKVTLL